MKAKLKLVKCSSFAMNLHISGAAFLVANLEEKITNFSVLALCPVPDIIDPDPSVNYEIQKDYCKSWFDIAIKKYHNLLSLGEEVKLHLYQSSPVIDMVGFMDGDKYISFSKLMVDCENLWLYVAVFE